jgi:RNA recognition motif-containing protein
MVKLFIVGISRDMRETELLELFSAHGQVNAVTIVTEKESGKSLGYGFLTMTDESGARRAIAAMDGATIDDRKISVRIAEDKRAEAPNVFTAKAIQSSNRPKYSKVEMPIVSTKKKRPRKQV